MGLKKDLILVSSSNLIVLFSGILNGLVLPGILTIESFANLKTYALYASFIGLLHFGFVDGINIKYGGKSDSNIDNKKAIILHNFFLFFQIIIFLLFLIFGLIIKSNIFFLLILAILPYNLQSFFLFYYQALGKFKEYSIATVISPVMSIFFTVILILFDIKDYYFYVTSNILGYLFSALYLEIVFRKSKKNNKSIKIHSLFREFLDLRKEIKMIFFSGIFILLGNILFNLYYDMGRWFAKLFFNNIAFANYSLGISLIGFVLIFINSINKTFYPHLFNNYNQTSFNKYKNTLYILGSFSLTGYFFLRYIVILFLPKYIESLSITAILITSIPGLLVVKSIYVNSYKILKTEKHFMYDSLRYLFVSIVIYLVSFLFSKNLNSIALASVISVYCWALFPINNKYFNFKIMLKELLYLFILFLLFYFFIWFDFNLITSIISFLLLLTLLNFMFFKKTILGLILNKE